MGDEGVLVDERRLTYLEQAVESAGREVFGVAKAYAQLDEANMMVGQRFFSDSWAETIAEALCVDMQVGSFGDDWQYEFGANSPRGRAQVLVGRAWRWRLIDDMRNLEVPEMEELVYWLAKESVDDARDTLREAFGAKWSDSERLFKRGVSELLDDPTLI